MSSRGKLYEQKIQNIIEILKNSSTGLDTPSLTVLYNKTYAADFKEMTITNLLSRMKAAGLYGIQTVKMSNGSRWMIKK
jgi:hypothetical protein